MVNLTTSIGCSALSAVIAISGATAICHGDDRFWIEPDGGSFQDPLNWSPTAIPGPDDLAIFELDQIYVVDFLGSATNNALRIGNDTVTFDIGSGHTYTLSNTFASVSMAEADGDDAVLTLLSGSMNTVNVRIGMSYFTGSPSAGSVLILPGASWINSDRFQLFTGLVTVAGGQLETDRLALDGEDGSATLRITGAGAQLSSDVLSVGGEASASTSILVEISEGATAAAGAVQVDHGSLVLDDASLTVRSLDAVHGSFDFVSGILSFTEDFDVSALGSSDIVLGPTQILDVEGIASIRSSERLEVAALTAGVIDNDGMFTVNGDVFVGGAMAHSPYRGDGVLVVTPGSTFTIQAAGFASVSGMTTLNDGVIDAPGGLVLPASAVLLGSGHLRGRIVMLGGALVGAMDDLALGDIDALDGYFSDGVLEGNHATVTLGDRDEAVLGSLTTIGDDSAGGTLAAPNGLLLEAGKSIAGYGTVDADLETNGFVFGEGPDPDDELLLSGDVTGCGDFGGNIVFGGTYSPGCSPAAVVFDHVAFTDDATLLIEIGGLIPGDQYDQLVILGGAALDGRLEIALIDGFVPEAGDTFTVIDGPVSGAFVETISPGGLTVAVLPDGVVVTAVQECPEDLDDSGDVGFTDLLAILATWGPCAGCPEDLDDSGDVGFTDLLAILANWGPCPAA